MDAQLQKLIEKIKEDGVQTAEEEAQRIREEAQKEAEKIRRDAKNEAEKLRTEAEQEVQRRELRGNEALKQAGRDLLLSLKGEIESLFDRYLQEAAGKALDDAEVMRDAVSAVLGSWSRDEEKEMEVLLPEKKAADLEKALKGKLAEDIKKGLEIKTSPDLDAGFRISAKDGSAFYDFSAEGLAAALSQYLNPRLAALVEEAGKES